MGGFIWLRGEGRRLMRMICYDIDFGVVEYNLEEL